MLGCCRAMATTVDHCCSMSFRLSKPSGRSLNSSRSAFEEIRRQPRSFMPISLGPQTPLSAPPVTLKRSFPPEASYTAGREIRPKPYAATGSSFEAPASEQPVKRRRGRPPKAQTMPIPGIPAQPPPTAVKPLKIVDMTPAMQGEPRSTLPPATRMPISAVLTPTATKTASQSSGSSGKRRRGRSTKSEPEELGQILRAAGHEYESPYGRAAEGSGGGGGGVLEDTPARTAVLRHQQREDFTPSQHLRMESEPAPHLPATGP